MKLDRLKANIKEMAPGIVAHRNDLNSHPVLAYGEVRTSSIIAQCLWVIGRDAGWRESAWCSNHRDSAKS